MKALLLGVRLGAGRLAGRALAVVALLALAASVVVALVERDREPLSAPGRAIGVVVSLVLPLACFATASLAVGGARLDDAAWPVARYGLARRVVALGLILSGMGAAVLLSAVAIIVTLALSYARAPGLWADAITCSWIASLGACAYVALFALGTAFFRLGRGRWVALIFDFIFAGGSGVVAGLGPRAHLRNLMGGAPVLELSQPESSVWLAALAAAFAVIAAIRSGD